MLEEYVKDNYYVRFDTHSFNCFRETHFNARQGVKSCQSRWSAKSRSNAPDKNMCLKTVSRTITMQELTLAAITASYTLMLDSIKL